MDRAGLSHVAPGHHVGEVPDRTIYPIEEKVGEDILQRWIVEQLRPLVERWLASRGAPTFVGADQFVYYRQYHPKKVIAPDLYVLPGVPPGRRVKSWKVWETGIVPSFALEVVSSNDVEKDYREGLERYAELGVAEVLLFDPDYRRSPDRVRWQRYCTRKARGFVQVQVSNADRMRSSVLGCFLRVVGEGDAARLRLATGPRGDTLVLLPDEEERAAKEKERAAKEKERAAKEAALARVAELEALLAKKQRKPKRA
jgi:hypothetical protein